MGGKIMHRLLTAIALSLLLFSTPVASSVSATGNLPGQATAQATVERIAGSTRYGTSEKVAAQWSPGVRVAYVVSGEDYPDALAAAAKAGAARSPVLLTQPSTVPAETARALRRLKASRIVVVGGTKAVSEPVVRSLKAYATSGVVQRVAGGNRYATAAALASSSPARPARVYLASGEDFPDALAAASIAGHQQVPLLLTRRNSLEVETIAQLRRLKAQEVVVLGGSSVVSDNVARQGASYTTSGSYSRVAGDDRYQTAVLVSQRFGGDASDVYVASGESFPDALVGAALAARRGMPMLLTPRDRVNVSTASRLSGLRPTRMYVLGGSSVISNSTLRTLGGGGGKCAGVLPEGTLFGSSMSDTGQGAEEAMREVDDAFGRVPIVRHFSSGLPTSWSSTKMRAMDGRTISTSFKAEPRQVLAGKHDAHLRAWFAAAPDDQTIYWTYYHEPEGEIKDGRFTAPDYRAAWKRIAGIADEACKPNMFATMILTGWTAKPASKQDYRDYYPGAEAIDVLAFDSYNGVKDPDRTYYASPEEMYGSIVAIAQREGIPFAVPETGTRLLKGDDGTRRAQWLRDIGAYLEKHDSLFVTYFQSDRNVDWRLDDPPSRRAWSDLVNS